MDVGSINAGYTSLKLIKECFEVILGYKIDIESQNRINAALKEVGTLQDTLFHAQEERFRLQTEMEKLRQELKSKVDFENRYTLFQAPGGDWVYASPGNVPPYACQSCWGKEGHEQILKIDNSHYGIFACPGCKVVYHVNPSQQRPQEFARGTGSPLRKHGWMG